MFLIKENKNMTKKLLLLVALTILLTEYLSAKDYKGAEFRTKQTYLYGRFEVSLKSAAREGMLSSFFTYHEFSTGIQDWNEIDIEILGRYENDIQFNAITPNQVNHESHYPLNFLPSADFHTYAFEWTPNYVAWFVDGVEVYRQTGAHIQTLNKAQKLMMNIWNPTYTNWAGVFDPNALPAFAYYDWVKYYTYTPGSGNYGTGNNFSLSWSDEFDYWNTARWEKGTHTFNGNGCDFVAANAVITNSKLILCLTDAVNLGYTDVKSPVFLSARVTNNKVIAYFSEELDSASAQTIGNFNIPGSTVTSARILTGLKSVELTVDGWDFTSARNLIVLNVKDRFNNTIAARAISIILERNWSWPIKINCGGTAQLGYLPESDYGFTTDYGSLDGSNGSFSAGLQINGTDEDEIFRSEKYGLATYTVRVPNGNYKVKLMFAENYFTQAGKRIFSVFLENSRVINQLDIFSEAGANTALIKEFNNIAVNDGKIDLHFVTHLDKPLINGIVIEKLPSGIEEGSTDVPGSFILNQNYPNPFNGQTVISFSVNKPGFFTFSLFSPTGEQLIKKELGWLEEGSHSFPLGRKELSASGIYFFSLATPSSLETKKLVLLN